MCGVRSCLLGALVSVAEKGLGQREPAAAGISLLNFLINFLAEHTSGALL